MSAPAPHVADWLRRSAASTGPATADDAGHLRARITSTARCLGCGRPVNRATEVPGGIFALYPCGCWAGPGHGRALAALIRATRPKERP